VKKRSRKKSKIISARSSSVTRVAEQIFGNPTILYGGLAAVLLLLSLTQIVTFDGTRGATQDTVSPVVAKVMAPIHAIGSYLSNTTSFTAMQAEIRNLRSENERLNEWYQTAQYLRAENQSLKALLNVKIEGNLSYLTTRILADPASPFIKTVLIDAGENDGVSQGQAVIGEGGLIGRVISVNGKTARVLLLNDINSRIPVMIEGTNQKAILTGHNDDVLRLEYIPETITINNDMRIITSGDGGLFPAGLPVGKVGQVKNNMVTVMPFARGETANYVRLLQKPENERPGSEYIVTPQNQDE